MNFFTTNKYKYNSISSKQHYKCLFVGVVAVLLLLLISVGIWIWARSYAGNEHRENTTNPIVVITPTIASPVDRAVTSGLITEMNESISTGVESEHEYTTQNIRVTEKKPLNAPTTVRVDLNNAGATEGWRNEFSLKNYGKTQKNISRNLSTTDNENTLLEKSPGGSYIEQSETLKKFQTIWWIELGL